MLLSQPCMVSLSQSSNPGESPWMPHAVVLAKGDSATIPRETRSTSWRSKYLQHSPVDLHKQPYRHFLLPEKVNGLRSGACSPLEYHKATCNRHTPKSSSGGHWPTPRLSRNASPTFLADLDLELQPRQSKLRITETLSDGIYCHERGKCSGYPKTRSRTQALSHTAATELSSLRRVTYRYVNPFARCQSETCLQTYLTSFSSHITA